MAHKLEALTFPLHGTRLIEASAGTGKTYTIAALYLRLVLGHGGASAHTRALTPEEILVVTFTKAATEELKDRIRARLVEGAACFRQLAEPDDYLRSLMADFPEEDHPRCALMLDQAAQLMDLAAVHTIHGWCQRMLREHAFDSGSLFSQEMEADTAPLREEAVRDYWRRFLYPQSRPVLAAITNLYASPEALEHAVIPLMGPLGEGEAPADPFALLNERAQAVAETKSRCRVEWPTFVEQFNEALANKWVKGNMIKAGQLENLTAWLEGNDELPLDNAGKVMARYTTGTFADALSAGGKKQPQTVADSPVLAALENLARQLASNPIKAALLRHCAHWVAERVAEEKRRRAQLDFDDLIKDLGAALEREHQAGGDKLASAIRHQFPVALIDEFQDTDQVQYRLFQRLYLDQPDTALLMIGDPKQAIYGFRGADIHTYLKARLDTEGRHYTLDTNYRSTQAMVDAANAVFELGERHPDGPFLHGDAIPFLPVAANGRKEVLMDGDRELAAMTLWWDDGAEDGVFSKGDYVARQAEACAEEITRLLNGATEGRVGFERDDMRQPLAAADIAILVRDFREAGAVRDALSARGVRSVYLSDKDSVFASEEAEALQRILQAVANPTERAIKAALATAVLGFSWSALDAFNHDELAWERELAQFRELKLCWQRQGVLPMIRRLLAHYGVARRALADPRYGERRLTNLLHLAELLQSASAQLDGELALIRFLAEQREEGSLGDEQVLRLESDAALVKVITIHKSKGLEYPLVFLPFIAGYREASDRAGVLFYRDADGKKTLTFEADDAAREAADRERLEEDLRLLYVALTRPRHGCYLGLAPVKMSRRGKRGVSDIHRGALGCLLGAGAELDGASVHAALQALAQQAGIALMAPPESTGALLVSREDEAALTAPALYRRTPQRPWWIASYSALLTGMSADHSLSGLPERLMEVKDELAQEEVQTPAEGTIHAFPKGAMPGTFLHDLFEWAAGEGRAAHGAGFAGIPDALLSQEIETRCDRHGYEAHVPVLNSWFRDALSLPLELPTGTVSLAGLDQVQAEMEFWISANQLEAMELDRLVREAVWPGESRPQLRPNQVNGMLKGFIDLTFLHGGRYYVADYKSNYLGADERAYTAEAMRQAMLEHRYDLQAVLYTLALHRLLQARLPDYDFDRHIGGGLYLFLRGLSAHHPGHGVVTVPVGRQLIEQLDARFRGAALESLSHD
ncbi:exodeoxyribonuclease V subunit beta [Ferrimonas balearica]|uniref:exodeoxyribonuclease V subunit beta n=1 Tax=Ferrimonas balearica TaxID=44012 RepID=UPI001C99969E|nr:exodeoxyribonuclease V subunit beta [Ferrimonas balearica]MBY5921041.1 exodeoxyribonuclease V subunit beta [Ferrimonas balearica]MBY5996274.1 exodeoxyribonuclease V subunit beta [Ferrimonas balearica]